MTYARKQTPVAVLEPSPVELRQLEGKWKAISPHQVWQSIEMQGTRITVAVKGQPSLRGYFSVRGQQLEVTLTSGVASGRTIEFLTNFHVSSTALALEFSVSSFEFQRQIE